MHQTVSHTSISLHCDSDGRPMRIHLPLTTFKLAELHGVRVMHERHQVEVMITTDLRPNVLQRIDASSFWSLRCAHSPSSSLVSSLLYPSTHSFTWTVSDVAEEHQQGMVNLTFSSLEPQDWLLEFTGIEGPDSVSPAVCQLHAGGIATDVLFPVGPSREGEEGAD